MILIVRKTTTVEMVRNSGNNSSKDAGYVVEKIVDKRITVQGRVEYFIKWRGYPNSQNSWEPEENCDCPAIIQRFEESRAKSKKRGVKKPKIEEILKARGYERGLKIDRILGATNATANGEIYYLVKWQTCPEFDLLPSSEIQERNPEILIDFYEKHSSFANKLQERLKTTSALTSGSSINKSGSPSFSIDNFTDPNSSLTSKHGNQTFAQNVGEGCHQDNSGVKYSATSLPNVDHTTIDVPLAEKSPAF